MERTKWKSRKYGSHLGAKSPCLCSNACWNIFTKLDSTNRRDWKEHSLKLVVSNSVWGRLGIEFHQPTSTTQPQVKSTAIIWSIKLNFLLEHIQAEFPRGLGIPQSHAFGLETMQCKIRGKSKPNICMQPKEWLTQAPRHLLFNATKEDMTGKKCIIYNKGDRPCYWPQEDFPKYLPFYKH